MKDEIFPARRLTPTCRGWSGHRCGGCAPRLVRKLDYSFRQLVGGAAQLATVRRRMATIRVRLDSEDQMKRVRRIR
jgi:hypothetical protein